VLSEHGGDLPPAIGPAQLDLSAGEGGAALGFTLLVTEVRDADYERAFANIVAERAGAVFVLSSPILNRNRTWIIALAAKHRLPRSTSDASSRVSGRT